MKRLLLLLALALGFMSVASAQDPLQYTSQAPPPGSLCLGGVPLIQYDNHTQKMYGCTSTSPFTWVQIAGPGGVSSVAWGGITGTLSAQTDLNTALAAKVPTTTTVNGHALSGNVTVSASDLTTGTLPHAQLPTLVSGDIPNNAANTSGTAANATLAAAATALAANPGNCSAGNLPRGVDASGTAEGCAPVNLATESTGTVPAGQIPNPSASTLGGIESFVAVTHQWIRQISTSGVPTASQPACADISDAVSTCNTLPVHSVTFVIDGGGSAIATGACKLFLPVRAAGTINKVELTADQSGSITVDIWKAAGAIPTSGNKISASAPATLSSAQINQTSSLTGWTTSVSVDDVFGCTVASVTTVTRVTVQIWYQ